MEQQTFEGWVRQQAINAFSRIQHGLQVQQDADQGSYDYEEEDHYARSLADELEYAKLWS